MTNKHNISTDAKISIPRIMRPTKPAIVVFLQLLAALYPTVSSATEFNWDGSSGDAGFKDFCPAGQFLVGLSIRSGSWMDRLSITCAPVSPDGITGAVWHGPTRGGNGGGPSEKTCPPNHVIDFMGMVFTGGKQQVTYFRFSCKSTTSDDKKDRTPMEIGAPSTVFPDSGQQCPAGEAANGLQGRFGQHVNAAGLECAKLIVNKPAIILPTPPNTAVPPEWNDMLQAHNSTRAGHCAAPLTWNAQLAAAAQAYAQQCNIGVHGSSGENLADFVKVTNGVPVLPAQSNTTAYQSSWACEEQWYNYSNPVFSGGFKNGCDAPVNGHFTQIVWKDTTQLGCGKATCNIGGIQGTHWVCRYAPAGNVNAGDANVLRREVQRPPCQ